VYICVYLCIFVSITVFVYFIQPIIEPVPATNPNEVVPKKPAKRAIPPKLSKLSKSSQSSIFASQLQVFKPAFSSRDKLKHPKFIIYFLFLFLFF
jgi:hypothetical protein